MPKLKAPLFSLKATGRLGKVFSLAKRQGRHIIERRPIPTDAKSSSQLFSRLMFNKCIDLWHLLSDAERQEWESLARPRHMTGYAWYISQCLRPNPGIYLPLIGGTMTGDIDMGKHSILKLPLPTDAQEAASKAYVDALAPGLHADTHEDGGADEIDVGGLAGLLADDQHIIDAEAVTAMGVKGDANPLHHDKYTTAQAVAAAKTVKLDDFATPDDNVDLNASVTRHGLFKKLDGVATHFLNGLGNWVFAGGATLTVAETQVYSGVKQPAWVDLDLSGTVGSQATLVILKVRGSSGVTNVGMCFRRNGDTDDQQENISSYPIMGASPVGVRGNDHAIAVVVTDTSGVIEWKCYGISATYTIDVIAYIK